MICPFHNSFLRDRAEKSEEGFLYIEEKTSNALSWMSLNLSSLSSSSLSSLSSSEYEKCLRLHHRELVNGVEATHIMDYLFQEELLTLDDLQLIPSFPVQSHRMRCLLTAIYRRIYSSHPETVIHHFLLSLSDDYSFLERKLRETLEQLATERHSSSSGDCTSHDAVVNGPERRENDSSLSEVVTVVEVDGGAIEEPEETLHFPVMESTDLNDANSNALCRLSPPGEYLRQKEDSQLSPSYEQYLQCQTEIVRRLRDSAFDEFSGSSLGVYTSATLGPLSMPPSNHGRKFKSPFHRKLFDFLSSSVNDQAFDRYDLAKVKYSSRAERDPDTLCLILYLDACKCAIQSDFATCKRTIAHSLDVAALTSSPNRFYVLCLSVRIWVNLKRRRLAKVRSTLGDALNVIGQDPVTCSGMTAGWIYVDEAKLLMATITSSLRHAHSIRSRAISAMERALEQFSLDESADGPYGRNFASVKLASLLLACDDRLTWADVLEPTDADLARADELLDMVDDSVTGICSILKPLFLVAQSDRKFRSGNFRRAVELAKDAEDLASRNGLHEEEELARLRSSRYSQLVGGRGVAMPALERLSSSEEADKEDSGDDRGSDRSRGVAGEGGGCRLRKKRKRNKKMNWNNSFSDFRKHLFNVNHRLCLLFLLFLILLFTVLSLTVAFAPCRANVSSWDQRDLGPTGPMIRLMAPSSLDTSIQGDDH